MLDSTSNGLAAVSRTFSENEPPTAATEWKRIRRHFGRAQMCFWRVLQAHSDFLTFSRNQNMLRFPLSQAHAHLLVSEKYWFYSVCVSKSQRHCRNLLRLPINAGRGLQKWCPAGGILKIACSLANISSRAPCASSVSPSDRLGICVNR